MWGFFFSGCSDLCPWDTAMRVAVLCGKSQLLWQITAAMAKQLSGKALEVTQWETTAHGLTLSQAPLSKCNCKADSKY